MNWHKTVQTGLFGVLATLALTTPSLPATFSISRDPDVCKLVISGAIEQGDLQRFIANAGLVFTPDDQVGESTAANTVCLDSPGGNYVEGIKLAKHFYESGVGTVIRDGMECDSACALMFMMGRARGPEVDYVNRKLYLGGVLGFHRPTLALPPGGEFSSADIAGTYDVAVSSVVDFIALANKTAPWSMTPMVKADLIEQMFATPGDELFYIDTVEKAARWEIDLVGVSYPSRIDEAHAFYACENTLQWRVGLQSEPFSFTETMMSAFAEPNVKLVSEEGQLQVFDVTSRKAGYASAGCLIVYRSDGRLTTCAIDEYTGATWGSGDCRPNEEYETEWVSPLAVWKADTPITELRSPPSTERIRVKCVVKSPSHAILDEEICDARIAFEYEADGAATVLQVLIWPTGNQTVVRSGRGSHSVNGAPAERQYLEEFWGCYLNSATQNTLCIDGLGKRRAN